ncbi:MAG: hypothetical protein WDO69_06645 [Pseudomonadota bacterium]
MSLDGKPSSAEAAAAQYCPGKDLDLLLADEAAHVRSRSGLSPEAPLIALALSGGGVRSATVSLGFLEELAKAGLLSCFDYLSSVSGGSYASGYLFSATTAFGAARHADLFGAEAKRELLATGKYLAFGSGLQSVFRLIRLVAVFLSTSLLNLFWMISLAVASSGLFTAAGRRLFDDFEAFATTATCLALGFAMGVPFLRLTVLSLAIRVGGSTQIVVGKALNVIEGWNLILCSVAFVLFGFAPWLSRHTNDAVACNLASKAPIVSLGPWLTNHTTVELSYSIPGHDLRGASGWFALVGALIALLVGFFVSSDAIGLYSVFKNLIDSGYLNAGFRAKANRPKLTPKDVLARAKIQVRKRLSLHELRSHGALAGLPYPLYNAVTYLQRKIARADEPRKPDEPPARGRHSPDYFLFSPLYCGAFTTGYVRLGRGDKVYDRVTLADAVTCSAASLSPLMHGDTNRLVALGMLIANLNLSSWFANPNRKFRRPRIAFWPLRYLKMLFGKLHEDSPFIPVADGAFTDNLGVIELLRRRCRLIVCIDSTFDPGYSFGELRNLIVRARNEERVVIQFPDGALARIKPSPLTGFAETQFLIGDLIGEGWSGRFVYVKACLTQPLQDSAPDVERDAADYQTYHATFPQETTADQFFDPPQWHAYNALGRELGRAALEAYSKSAPALDVEEELLSSAERRRALLRSFDLEKVPTE